MPLAKPSSGIEELVDETSGKEIIVTPPLINRFEELTKKYEDMVLPTTDLENKMSDFKYILNPTDINLFLQSTTQYEHRVNQGRYEVITGSFVSRLIQCSYNEGYNGFTLDLTNLIPMGVGRKLKGTQERPLEMNITGKAGDFCGSQVEYGNFIIKEAANWCGMHSKHSRFEIKKSGFQCGVNSQNSIFTIGNAGSSLALQAEKSTFIVDTTTDDTTTDHCASFAHDSVFKTKNIDQLNKFKIFVKTSRRNKLYFIHPDGSEEEISPHS